MSLVIEQFGVRTTSGDPTSAEIPYAVWGALTSEEMHTIDDALRMVFSL